MTRAKNLRCCIGLVAAVLLFYWKLFLPSQFSFLTGTEETYQAFSWLNFWVRSLHHLTLPIWDSNAYAGYLFPGEMQTSAFNPLNLPVLLFPLSRYGMLSTMEYHIVYLFGHVLAALFMFALVRELKLSRFAAFLAGFCFAVSGIVGKTIYPDLVDSACWLPLIFLFMLRALKSANMRRTVLNCVLAGLCLGTSVMGGRLHMTIAAGIFVVTGLAFYASQQILTSQPSNWLQRPWPRAAAIAALILVTGFCAGAIQLLPSHVYAEHTIRFYGDAAFPGTQKPPYIYTTQDALSPAGLLSVLFPSFANIGQGETWTPYIGVLPFLMAVVAVVRYWSNIWIKYLLGLTIAVAMYVLSAHSALHGLLYVVIPYLWIVREATRFEYLANFALAVMAAFGFDLVFSNLERCCCPQLRRLLFWTCVGSAIALALPVLWPSTGSLWVDFSLLMILSASVLLWFALGTRTRITAGLRFIVITLVFFDLSAFNWVPYDKLAQDKAGSDEYQTLLSLHGPVAFLKAQTQPFRVHVFRDPKPNIADSYGIQTVEGAAATLNKNFARIGWDFDLLNVRYFIKPASATDAGPVYVDNNWKVFENPAAFPRAWLVHATRVEPNDDQLYNDLANKAINLRDTALLSSEPAFSLPPPADPSAAASDRVALQSFSNDSMTFKVHASSVAVLVASEMYWPEWQAILNGKKTQIFRADGALRGVLLPQGDSVLEFRYLPWSFYVGAALTTVTFVAALFLFVSSKSHKPLRPPA